MRKIYLDVCCLNRPLDDQAQERIQYETAAIMHILSYFATGQWQWLGSEMVAFEIAQIRDALRRRRIALLATRIHQVSAVDAGTVIRARELMAMGFQVADSLHLACAEQAGADAFLTTDDRLLRRAMRMAHQLRVVVANPATWLEEITEQ
jgi:predicted nucleic acid-binding protein